MAYEMFLTEWIKIENPEAHEKCYQIGIISLSLCDWNFWKAGTVPTILHFKFLVLLYGIGAESLVCYFFVCTVTWSY